MGFENRMTSLKLSARSMVRSDPKKQARGVEITQILRENLAKELQNFRNFGAPCAERIAGTLGNKLSVQGTLRAFGRSRAPLYA